MISAMGRLFGMSKKLVYLGIAGVMFFSIAGLYACDFDNDFEAYKTTAKSELDTYAQNRGESNYCDNNWLTLLGLVDTGKATIDAAVNTEAVDIAVAKAKNAIDNVPLEKIEMMEIVSIHFYTTKSLIGRQNHQFYDFIKMIYSTKTIIEGDEEEQLGEYMVHATFTEEQVTKFFKNAYEQGLFLLKDIYRPVETINDGNSWDLEIQLKDGTTFKSSGYIAYPAEAKELDKIFFELSGYKLFGIL